MKYIRKFSSIASSKAATLYSPTVILVHDASKHRSMMKQIGTIDTKMKVIGTTLENLMIVENTDPIPYGFVDLGLPSGLLWDGYNLGVDVYGDLSTPEAWYGNYYAWADVTGYPDTTEHNFRWSDYAYADTTSGELIITKYNEDDGLTVIENTDDPYPAVLGGGFRMPTKKDLNELLDKTTSEWVKDYNNVNGLNGRLLTSLINGNTLFIPSAGYANSGSVDNIGDEGFIWTSSLNNSSSYQKNAWCLCLNDNSCSGIDTYRYYGQSVRGVYVPRN